MPLTEVDRYEIQQLVGRCSLAADSFDGDAFADCFTADGAFESDLVGRFEGRDVLRVLIENTGPRYAKDGIVPRNWSMNLILEGDGVQATATSYNMVIDTAGGGSINFCGVYRDRLTKVDGSWKFAERLWTTDGGVSEELAARADSIVEATPRQAN
jgi:hypothetical protein